MENINKVEITKKTKWKFLSWKAQWPKWKIYYRGSTVDLNWQKNRQIWRSIRDLKYEAQTEKKNEEKRSHHIHKI